MSSEAETDRLDALLEEAMVDAYGEDEQFLSMAITLGERLCFPLQATVIGHPVEVLDIDDSASSPRRGIVAVVRSFGKVYRVGLSELTFVDPDPVSAEWLEAYHYWLEP